MPYRSLLFVLNLPLLLLLCCSDDSAFGDKETGVPPVDGAAGDRSVPPKYDGGQWDITVGPPVQLSLATFNVKDFFDTDNDPKHKDELPSSSAVVAKIKKLGLALRKLKADVLALQEVENLPLLNKLNSQELGSLGYKHVRLIEGNDIRGIDVALLSRFEVTSAKSHKWDTFYGIDGSTQKYGFSRDCLEATVEPSPGRKLYLLVNHLRASTSPYQESLDRRQAQAKRVREIADEILKKRPSANLAVLGDLNDKPGTKTLSLIQQGPPTLFDLVTLLPQSQRNTFKTTQLDYILVSPGLKDDYTSGSVSIDHTTVMQDVSDHYPVKASFTLQ
jgi:endonuclease/exonuclease/phosphatase family metal-dependent hydrolase